MTVKRTYFPPTLEGAAASAVLAGGLSYAAGQLMPVAMQAAH